MQADIRQAVLDDVPGIVRLVADNARRGGLLPRSEANIRASIDNFLVAELDGRVIGCGSLLPMSANLAELRSLAVDAEIRGGGIGARLVARLIDAARERQFSTLFALTRAITFFEKCGFTITPKENFPEKVWNDCVACPLLANCDEVAVTLELDDAQEAPIPNEGFAILEPAQLLAERRKGKMTKRQNVNKVVLAYSGGLDTSVIVPWLKENYGCEVVAFVADVGQGDDLDAIRDKALKSGASKVVIEDLRNEFAKEYLFPLVQSGAAYEHGYLLGSAISRPLIAKYQVDVASREGADAVAHGATGKGNDQVRFELTYMALNPRLKVIAPWREWAFKGREDLIAYAKRMHVPLGYGVKNNYTRDGNLWHLSHEGGDLVDPWIAPSESVYERSVSPETAPDTPDYVEVEFVSGVPRRVNGKSMGAAEIILLLNEFGLKHGVGRVDMVENRLVGMKSRAVYETPGGTILRVAHQGIEQLTLDRETTAFKQVAALKFADIIYDGRWFTPLRDALQAFISVTQRDVTGTARVRLFKGVATLAGRKATYSLYREDLATFSRDEVYNQRDADGFIRLFGLPMRVKAQVDLNRIVRAAPMDPAPGDKRD
ncbi:MAG TPA: argininosuccinate synthase [Thermoflexales bacterium]|nr:argininosuccinate synthase [Thermoflexales bacterium]HQY26963.1 argininosuccinate synthase [Thermoflexales bacterium]